MQAMPEAQRGLKETKWTHADSDGGLCSIVLTKQHDTHRARPHQKNNRDHISQL